MRTLLALPLLAFVPLVLAAAEDKSPPEGWKEVSGGYKKQAFTVWLPKDAKITENEDSFVSKYGQIRVFRTVCETKDGPVFLAGQITIPPDLTKAPLKDRQNFFRELFLNEVKGKLIDEKNVSLGTMSGKEYTAETPDGLARYRIYGTGVQMFRVLAIGTKKQMESKDVTVFLDSLKRAPVEGTKPPEGTKPLEAAAGTHDLPDKSIDGMILEPDNKTLVVSVSATGQLVFFDTTADKELKKVDMDFKPGALAAQGKRLFVGTKGAPVVHVVDAATGKEIKEIKLSGGPVESIACHPVKGLVYATNEDLDVFSIDPEEGKVTRTKAHGQNVVVDPSNGAVVYTSIYKPSKNVVIVEELPNKQFKVELVKGANRNVLMKFAADGADLKLMAANDNAGSGSVKFAISHDGKRLAMGGPYRTPNDKGLVFDIAVWDTADLTTILGKFEAKGFMKAVAFHPQLDLAATMPDNNTVGVFNSKSMVKKQTFPLPQRHAFPYFCLFAGEGTVLITAVGTNKATGDGPGPVVLQIHPLTLSDEQRDELKKSLGK